MIAVWFVETANSMWQGGIRMLLTYRLEGTRKIIPPQAMPVRMPQPVDVADWKEASNVQPNR